jgi:hypothetical protein
MDIDLGGEVGQVSMVAGPGQDATFRDAAEVFFFGRGYLSREEAERAGVLVRNVVRLASADSGLGLNVGRQDRARNRPGQAVIDKMAAEGFLALPDVHGLQVYEETGTPAVIRVDATLAVRTPMAKFRARLADRVPDAADLDNDRAVACDLWAQSGFESSQVSALFSLVTALEVLGERREREGPAAELVEAFLEEIREAVPEAGEKVRSQLNSLLSGAEGLQRESIGAAVRRLAESVPASEVGDGISPIELVRRSYKARSELIHKGATRMDLGALIGPLGLLVRYLCTRHPEGDVGRVMGIPGC